ncbi:MAG: phosphotransferase [Clostridia bacterium]|nr:phosphotransferase [Clostridia bacterium]
MDFDALCEQLNLGALTEEPTRLTGGLMHKMYRIATASGDYAVKCLNPHVMVRADAARNFAAAEKLERKLEQTDLPLLPAHTLDGRKMQEMEGDFFYVFPYFEGKALKDEAITAHHCAIVGGLLAKLHAVENVHAPVKTEMLTFDWDGFDLSEEDKTLLWQMQTAANNAALPPLLTICHNDMDPKNLLWNGLDCRIIDLECLGYGSPYLELLETALCWAGYESGSVDIDRFTAFVGAYARAGADLAADWAAVYAANAGRLAWLHYNLLRAGGSEGEENRALGKAEAEKTLTCIKGYEKMKETIVGILKSYT